MRWPSPGFSTWCSACPHRPPPERRPGMRARQYLARPSKEAIRALTRFGGLPLERICVVDCPGALERAREAIMQVPCIGFDTETRPNFQAGQTQTGPHLVQMATPHQAFLFVSGYAPAHALLAEA